MMWSEFLLACGANFNLLPPSFEEWISQRKQGQPIPTDSLLNPMYHTIDRDDDDDDDDDNT